MDSPYIIFGLLIFITGLFLAIAMSIQFCACLKTIRRIQREKARLREVQEAAAQPPPPYAVVVSSCHLNPRSSPEIHHHQQLSHGGRHICCIIGTVCQHEPSSASVSAANPSSLLTFANNAHIRETSPYFSYANPEFVGSPDDSQFRRDNYENDPPTYEQAVTTAEIKMSKC